MANACKDRTRNDSVIVDLWPNLPLGAYDLHKQFLSLNFRGVPAMAQAFSRRPLTADASVRARVSLHVGFVVVSDTGTGSSPSSSVFPC
jgi:hypothetical protein